MSPRRTLHVTTAVPTDVGIAFDKLSTMRTLLHTVRDLLSLNAGLIRSHQQSVRERHYEYSCPVKPP